MPVDDVMNEVTKYLIKCPVCGGPCKDSGAWAKEAQAKVTARVKHDSKRSQKINSSME